jgi:hypothetical protein
MLSWRLSCAAISHNRTQGSWTIDEVVSWQRVCEVPECRRFLIGAFRLATLTWLIFILRSSRGSSCAAIPIINARTTPASVRESEELRQPRQLPSAGDCDFAVDPNHPANKASLIWLPYLDPSTVLLAPAPQGFKSARIHLMPTFVRRSPEGEYLIVGRRQVRQSLVRLAGARPARAMAVLIPLDANAMLRAERALDLWRAVTGRSEWHRSDQLTLQRRKRLTLSLRALDGHLSGETYRAIAEALFGSIHIPAGVDWKTHDLRDRTIRLTRAGVRLMQGGYLDLLG